MRGGAQFDATDLSGGGGGVRVDEDCPAGSLVGLHAFSTVGDEFVLGHYVAVLENDERDGLVQLVGIGRADHDGLSYGGVCQQPGLHFGRCHPHATDFEDVVVAAE